MLTPYYEQDGITIYHGDCCEVLDVWEGRRTQTFDLLLTDPPYGIGAHAGTGKYGREKWTTPSMVQWDSARTLPTLLVTARRFARRAIIWGGNYFDLPPSRMYLVWDKGAGFRGRDFAECEQAWCSWDGNAKVFTRDPLAHGDYHGKQHPTEKPEAVMLWCLSVAGPTTSIFDPFMGSGSTLVAARRLGRQAIGIEREERYCEIAATRLAQRAFTFVAPPAAL